MTHDLVTTARSLRIDSVRKILLYAIALTLGITAIPVCFVYLAIGVMLGEHGVILCAALTASALIPMFIAFPACFILLYVLYIITKTIDRVNTQISVDPLTGAMTRGYFLNQIREKASAGGAFLMIDADHFKQINDTYGHDVGDAALIAMSAAVISTLPPTALFGRLGGEEFGAFLPATEQSTAIREADNVLRAIRRAGQIIASRPIGMTASIGCAMLKPGKSIEETIREADALLYQAKRNGRNRCESGAADLAVAKLAMVSAA